MSKTAPLRVGVVGCGGMAAGLHIPAIIRIPELELAAVCDINPERLASAAAQFGVTRTFADFREMLDGCELDAVGVIGPPDLHVQVARVCLEKQIPFMTEKPLATKLEDARELAELAAKHGDCGMVAYTSRFGPANRMAWGISRSEEFGPITYVATTHLSICPMPKGYWGIDDLAESFIKLHGVHAIDLWRFFGGDPVEVNASVAGLRVAEDGKSALGSILAHARTSDGPHGTIHMKAGASHNGDINVDVMGQSSRARIEDEQSLNYEQGSGGLRQAFADDLLSDTLLAEATVGQYMTPGLASYSYYPDFFRFEWMAFARSLVRGIPLSPSITDAYRTTCLTEAICQSLREGGGIVRVEY